jgi:hypothetical protein
MSSRSFLEKFLRPNFEEWAASPIDERRAMNAILSLNQMADWYFVDNSSIPTNVGCATRQTDYRKYLVENECAEFKWIWDLADAHKHFKLARNSAIVRSADQVAVQRTGYFEEDYCDDDYVDDWDELIIDLGSGKVVPLMHSAQLVLKMWERLVLTCGQ